MNAAGNIRLSTPELVVRNREINKHPPSCTKATKSSPSCTKANKFRAFKDLVT